MTSKAALSRRQILAAGAAGVSLSATGASAQRTLTAGEVHARMKANLGTPWRDGVGVDRFIAGGPETVVRGVATVMMCSFDALKDSLKAGCNFVITHEPTYWSHQDRLDELRDDPLYKVKLDSGAMLRSSMANTARMDRDIYGAGQRVVAWFTPDDCVVLEQ